MSTTVASRRRAAVAVGAVLAAGLIPLATSTLAHAEGDDGGAGAASDLLSHTDDLGLFMSAADPGFISNTDDLGLFTAATDPDFISSTTDFGLFTVTSAADPDDDDFVAVVFSSPLFTDVLTSGADPENNLADFGAPGDTGIGVAGETVNTFESSMFPSLDSTFSLPFTDPLAELFTELIQLGLI